MHSLQVHAFIVYLRANTADTKFFGQSLYTVYGSELHTMLGTVE